MGARLLYWTASEICKQTYTRQDADGVREIAAPAFASPRAAAIALDCGVAESRRLRAWLDGVKPEAARGQGVTIVYPSGRRATVRA